VAAMVGALHEKLVFPRRVRILADHLASLIPVGSRILDVGCGDGSIDRLLLQQRPDLTIEGIDVLVRPESQIPIRPFNGSTIPHPGGSFNIVMFVDVLHHTIDPHVLLREAARVGSAILIKDHFCEGLWAGPRLRFMDWVGNAHHGVALPYNYWNRAQWAVAFEELGLRAVGMNSSLALYPPAASWLFDSSLHFVARLEPVALVSRA
jgi:SAM-dependent methyltransferase